MNSMASLVLQVNATSVNAATISLNQLANAGAQAQSATTNLTSATNSANSSILANQQAWFSNTAAINSSTQAMSHLANSFKSAFFGASIAVGLIELKNHFINLTESLIQTQVQVDKLRNSLNFAVGKSAAVGDLAFIKQSAQDMGLSFVTVTEQYVRLAAASRQTSLEGQKTKDIFTAVSQASTVLGLSADETTGALRAITQMISKNTVMSEELKGQLGERLPGAFQIAARAMGVTTQELNKMLETGKVLAEDFLPKFAAQLLKETAPDIEAASQSMQASLNRLETAWTLFKQAVVKSGLGQSMSNEISGLGNYLSTLSESMDQARASGSGLSGQLMTGLGTALARMPFDAVNTSANLLNGTLNLLSAGTLNLSTNVNILPQMFETSAYASSQLASRLKEAEQDLSQLQAKLAVTPDNIYLKSEAYQAYLLVMQLRDAKKAKDDLTGNAGRGSVNPLTIGQMEEAAAKAQQKIDALMAKSSSVPDAYIKRAKEIAEANKDGAMTAQQLAVALGDLHSLLPKVSSAHTKLSEAQKLVNAGEKAYGDIMAKDTGYAANFTETILAMAAARDKNNWSAEKYNEVVNAYISMQPGMVALTKEQTEAQKLLDKAYADTVKLLDAYEKDQRKAIASAKDEVTKAQESYDAHGKLASVIQQETLARLENNRAIMVGAGEDLSVIDAQIAAKKKIIDLLQKGEARDAVEELAEANKKAAEESSKYWEDALMRAFESGKGFFESLWSTIKNTLKTQVLKVLVTGTMSALGMNTVASAASSAGGSLITSLAGSAASSAITSNTIASAVTSGVSAFWGGLTASGATAAGAASAGLAYAGSGAAGGAYLAGSSASTALSAVPVYGWIAAAVVAAWAYVANRGETRSGATYMTGADGNAFKSEGPSGGEIAGETARAIFDSTTKSINDTLKLVGSQAAVTGFTAGLESSESGKGFAFAGGYIGDKGFGEYLGRNGGQFAMSDKSPQQAVEDYVKNMNQAWLQALQVAEDVPALIKAQLVDPLTGALIDIEKLSDADLKTVTSNVEGVINSVINFGASLKLLPFESLYEMSFKATAELINMAGGIETLSTNLAGYYDNFYSESEKTANLTRVLGDNFAALGQTMPTDNLRDWYRTQVEAAMAADQSVPANAALTASLLAMQGGVNTLAKTSEDAARAALDAAAAQKKQTQENIAATLGFDASGLSDMIMNAALNPAAGMSAAESFAATLEETIKNQLISNTVSSISQSIFDSIITPMMLGQAVSEATLDEITAAATARLAALDALFNSPEFQTGLQNIITSVSTTVAGLGGFGGSASGSAADQPFVQYMDNVVAAIDPIAEALKSVADRIAALQPKDTAATRAAEIAKALADFGTDGTWIDTLIPGGGKGGTDVWVKEFIASNENAVTRALTELYKLEDQRKAQDSARSIIAIQGELAKYLGDTSMASGVMRWNRADTLAKLNEQDPSGALAGEQQKLWDAKNISDFNRALLEASGDTAGLAAFDRAASDIALVLEGWSQDQINALNAQIDLAEATVKATELASINTGWQDKIDLLTGATTDRQLQHTRDLADATDATTKALIEQYYAQLDIADATTTQTSLLDRYKPKMDLGGAWDAVLDAGIDRRGTGKMSADGIRQWFADMIAAANPLTTEGQATIETLSGLAGAIDVIAQAAADAATKAAELAKTNQGYQDQIDVLSGARTQVQVDRENALAAATDASTKALMLRLYALQDEAEAAAKAAELLKVNAGWQSQLDVLLGNKTQKEVDRAAALAEVTDESTRALMLQVYAQQDMAEAATASIDAMKALSAELDQIADFRSSIGDAQQNIRSQMTGYDAVAYGRSQVDRYTAQLAGATTTQGRVDAGAGLRDAITGRYDAELALINKNRDAAEQSAREAFDAQTQADSAAIQSANQINAAYRQIGEYVKGLVTGADAPYSLASRYAAAQADYSTTLALAQAGDKDALSRITGAQGNLLSTAREQSVSSVDYARTFGRTINELSALAAKAGPDLESVTRQFYFDSSAFDQQALDLQTSAITELEDLATLTDEWTAELQDKLSEQALAFANIGLNTQQTADYTSKIEPGFERVAVAIDSAIQAQNAQAALLAEIQGLRTEVARLSTISQKTADNTAATAQTLDSVSGGGGPLLVQTA